MSITAVKVQIHCAAIQNYWMQLQFFHVQYFLNYIAKTQFCSQPN